MRTLLLTLMVLTLAGIVGCQNKNQAAKNGGVLDVTGAGVGPAPIAPREPELAYTATPSNPGYYDTSFAQTPAASGTLAAAGSSYTVKKGDTLFSIAKASYGNGNQWQKIAGANPGLSPATLKAGQRIVVP